MTPADYFLMYRNWQPQWWVSYWCREMEKHGVTRLLIKTKCIRS